MLNRINLVGPWAGLPVAWNDDDEFDEETYRADIARCCHAGIPGIYTGGTTGEFYAQEFDEFQHIAQATVDECHQHNQHAMIGCTATSTRGAMRRAAFAAKIGADAIQVALPFWLEVSDQEILPFFKSIADAADGLPVSIYETTRAKKCLTIDQHQSIYAAIPQYVMVKANADTIGCSIDGCRALAQFVNVFVGEHLWAELGPHGAAGCCSAVVYWNPSVILHAWQCVREQNWLALDIHCRNIARMYQAIFAAFGPRGFNDSAYDRLGSRATGFLQTSLRCRGPYVSPTNEDIAEFRRLLEKHHPSMLTCAPISHTRGLIL